MRKGSEAEGSSPGLLKNALNWLSAFIGAFFMLTVVLFVMFVVSPTPSQGEMVNFLSSASWAQAFIYIANLVVATIGLTYIDAIGEQLRNEQRRTNREIYRILIGPQIQSTKRFIATDEVKSLLKALDQELSNGGQPTVLLSDFRDKIEAAGKKIKLPLLENGPISLDHMESALNEYNYICKLIADRVVSKDFATDMSQFNLIAVHERLEPFIRLRRAINGEKSKVYASHFSAYYEQYGPSKKGP